MIIINNVVVRAISDIDEIAFPSIKSAAEYFAKKYEINNLYALESKIMNSILTGEKIDNYKIKYERI